MNLKIGKKKKPISHYDLCFLPILIANRDYQQTKHQLNALQKRVKEEEVAFKQLSESKQMLVDELEALTQQLFEEANQLVATEAREKVTFQIVVC